MTLIEFVTITEEKVKKELKNKQGLEDTSIITLKLQDPDPQLDSIEVSLVLGILSDWM